MLSKQEYRSAQDCFGKCCRSGISRFEDWIRRNAERWPHLHAGVGLWERELLLFPVIVTVLTGLSFLFGGVCGAWQWWSCVVGVMVGGLLWGRDRQTGVIAAILFVLTLGGLWLLAGVALDLEWVDSMAYHSPAMKLLIKGWNPVQAATLEALHADPHPEAWDCWIWHILAMPRGPWIFSAEAFFFTRVPYALCFPLFMLLFTVTVAQVWRLMRPLAWWARVLAVAILWIGAPDGVRQVSDCAVFFGGVGVLSVMGRAMREERIDWTALVVFSFWLLCGKQVALITGLLFWLYFAGGRLIHAHGAWRVELVRFVVAGSVLVLLWGCVSVSPYLTMWRHYGHPLYPCYTTDPERFPAYDIVGDFQRKNADAAAMGHLGHFVNAYISQRVAQDYYRFRLGHESFYPRSETWAQGGDNLEESSGPTKFTLRLHFTVLLGLVLCFGKVRERHLSLAILLGMICVPTQMIGYTRYVPWWTFLDIVGLITLTQVQGKRQVYARVGLCSAFVLWWLPPLARLPLHLASTIDNSWTFEHVLDNDPPTTLYAYHAAKRFPSVQQNPAAVGNPSAKIVRARRTVRNLQLLCALEPRLTGAQIELLTLENADIERFPLFPYEAFRLLPQEGEYVVAHSLFRRNQLIPSRVRRMCNYPQILAQCLLIRFPALCYRRIKTLFY